jgi:hypothetical protein
VAGTEVGRPFDGVSPFRPVGDGHILEYAPRVAAAQIDTVVGDLEGARRVLGA